MAKSPEPDATVLKYPAITAYKQWVWKQIRTRNKTLQWLVDEMKKKARAELIAAGKLGITTGTLAMFLGPEHGPNPPSNSVLLPAINKTLGIAPPPVCDPSEELSQLVDRFRARWAEMTPRERRMLLELLGDRDE